jgi:hypothetical protein
MEEGGAPSETSDLGLSKGREGITARTAITAMKSTAVIALIAVLAVMPLLPLVSPEMDPRLSGDDGEAAG